MSEGKVYTFQVIEGVHVSKSNNKVYEKGTVFQSRHKLDEMFIGKFLRVPDQSIIEGDETVVNVKKEVKPIFDFENATDVSEKFPTAFENGLRVYQNAEGNFGISTEMMIAEGGGPINISNQQLTSPKAVNTFVNAYLKNLKQD
jgi:hypothetical protein